MPLSNRRRARRKDIQLQETSDVEMPDSSPSRPATKKRRVVSPQIKQSPDADDSAPDDHDESNENEPDNQDLVDLVIAYLSGPRDDDTQTRVLRDHSNAKTENTESIQAYAKIAGRNWTYYVKTLHVNIGREPDRETKGNDEQSSPVTIAARALPEVHVDLGPSKFVSRLHAEIFYDLVDAKWHIRVNGRNGVRVNNVVLKRGTDAVLGCGDIVEIANTQMMFVTPRDRTNIHPAFVERAQRLANGEEDVMLEQSQQTQLVPPSSSQAAPAVATSFDEDDNVRPPPPVNNGQPSLAPAPNFLRRQVTPPPRSPDTMGSHTAKQSPLYKGMMMESTEEIDYSKDSTKDLKPPYSYATLIAQAIFSSEEEKLTLSSIYNWIMERYAFYRHSQSGWQNSIRHNLSLNKAFQKVPRRTDEPGKGMKWQIAPEYREEYWKKQMRKGGTQSSAPSSPATKESFSRGGGGAHHGHNGLEAMLSADKRKSPQVSSPGFSSFPVAPVEAYTPERGSRGSNGGLDIPDLRMRHRNARDYEEQPSPLLPTRSARKQQPQPPPPTGSANQQQQTPGANLPRTYGLSDNIANSPPILSSSYYDETVGPSSSMITPAPQRQQPRLPPPSTAQIPSKFMPMSSPAQFWKFADIGSTPARPVPDMSPLKGASAASRRLGGRGGPGADGDGDDEIPSSSPPPANLGSPSRPMNLNGNSNRRLSMIGEDHDEHDDDHGHRHGEDEVEEEEHEREGEANGHGPAEEEDAGGFDLARGFQPIGSYHRQLSNAARATATS